MFVSGIKNTLLYHYMLIKIILQFDRKNQASLGTLEWLYMSNVHLLWNYCPRAIGLSKMSAEDITWAEVPLFTHF